MPYMLFKYDENNYVGIKEIAYKPASRSIESVLANGPKETAPFDEPSELTIELCDGETIDLKTDEADAKWKEFQAAIREGRQYI